MMRRLWLVACGHAVICCLLVDLSEWYISDIRCQYQLLQMSALKTAPDGASKLEVGATHLEVGVWEQEKHLLQLTLREVVGQVAHGVGARAGDVLKGAWLLVAQRQYPLLYILRHLPEQDSSLTGCGWLPQKLAGSRWSCRNSCAMTKYTKPWA